MQGDKQLPFSQGYAVNSQRVDAWGRLRMSRFFLDMQNIAGEHAELLGVGHSRLAEKGIIWMLMRGRLELLRPPLLGEPCVLTTWANTPDKAWFPRFFSLKTKEGEEVARASSAWALISLEKRRILPAARAGVAMPLLAEDIPGCALPGKPLEEGDLSGARILHREARYSDFDSNRHMNNARYIEWLWDAISMDYHARHALSWLQLSFQHEIAGEGEKELSIRQEGDAFYFAISGGETQHFAASGAFAPLDGEAG